MSLKVEDDTVSLHRIARNSRQLLHNLSVSGEKSRSNTSASPYDKLCESYTFPTPQSIEPILLTEGLSVQAARRVSQTFLRHAAELRGAFTCRLRITVDTWARTSYGENPETELAALHATYLSRYKVVLQRWVDSAIAKWRQLLVSRPLVTKPQYSTCPDGRSSFKQVRIVR